MVAVPKVLNALEVGQARGNVTVSFFQAVLGNTCLNELDLIKTGQFFATTFIIINKLAICKFESNFLILKHCICKGSSSELCLLWSSTLSQKRNTLSYAATPASFLHPGLATHDDLKGGRTWGDCGSTCGAVTQYPLHF